MTTLTKEEVYGLFRNNIKTAYRHNNEMDYEFYIDGSLFVFKRYLNGEQSCSCPYDHLVCKEADLQITKEIFEECIHYIKKDEIKKSQKKVIDHIYTPEITFNNESQSQSWQETLFWIFVCGVFILGLIKLDLF